MWISKSDWQAISNRLKELESRIENPMMYDPYFKSPTMSGLGPYPYGWYIGPVRKSIQEIVNNVVDEVRMIREYLDLEEVEIKAKRSFRKKSDA